MSHHARDGQSEPGAAAQDLTDAAHEEQRQGKAQTHAGAVQRRGKHVIFRGEHLCPSQNDAVYSNQFQECAQAGIQRRDKTMHQELDDCHERCNDDDIAGELDLFRDHLSQQGNDDIGADQHEHGGQAHADAVKRSRCDCQCGTHTQQSHQRRVFFQNTLCKFLSVVHAPVTS